MVSKHFALMLMVRVMVLLAVLCGLAVALVNAGYFAITLILLLLASAATYELYRFVSQTNAQLTRFLQAAQCDDFTQRFDTTITGGHFKPLANALNNIMVKFNSVRSAQQAQLQHLKSLTELVPVPLLSLFADGQISLHNHAARRLFASVNVNKIADLNVFGQHLSTTLAQLKPGKRQLLNFSFDGVQRGLTVMMSQVQSGDISEKLFTLQDIQSELDQAQLLAWQDLVRVLTHEIMNSITPITSLAKTVSSDLVPSLHQILLTNNSNDSALNELADVRRAVDTLANRAQGLIQFVQSYRSFNELPVPQLDLISLTDLFGQLDILLKRSWAAKGITLTINIEPATLQLSADPDLVEQVIINLLKNAEQALDNQADGQVYLSARMNPLGYVLLEVADNGPGISVDIAKQIFVPFYTTKSQGSGVGLALSRQIMAAHGGSISVGEPSNKGAKFTLIF